MSPLSEAMNLVGWVLTPILLALGVLWALDYLSRRPQKP